MSMIATLLGVVALALQIFKEALPDADQELFLQTLFGISMDILLYELPDPTVTLFAQTPYILTLYGIPKPILRFSLADPSGSLFPQIPELKTIYGIPKAILQFVLPDRAGMLFVQTVKNVTNRTFPLMNLPRELRIVIWQMAMPSGRRFPLGSFMRYQKLRGPQPPVIASVNHESRCEVLRIFGILRYTIFGVRSIIAAGIKETTRRWTHLVLFNPANDILTARLSDFRDNTFRSVRQHCTVYYTPRFSRRFFSPEGVPILEPSGTSFDIVKTIEIRSVDWCAFKAAVTTRGHNLDLFTGLKELRIVRAKRTSAPGTCACGIAACTATTHDCKVHFEKILRSLHARKVTFGNPTVNIYDFYEPRRNALLPAPASDN